MKRAYKLWDKIKVYEILKWKWYWKKHKLKEPINWIVTWYRTVFLWYTDYDDYDDWWACFCQIWKVRVLEVTFNIYKKPYKVEVERKLYKWMAYDHYWKFNKKDYYLW